MNPEIKFYVTEAFDTEDPTTRKLQNLEAVISYSSGEIPICPDNLIMAEDPHTYRFDTLLGALKNANAHIDNSEEDRLAAFIDELNRLLRKNLLP